MYKKNSWLRLFIQSFGGGIVLGYLMHFFLRTPLARAFEYAGIIFLLLSVVFFMTPSFTAKKNNRRREDTSYVFIFGITGFLLLFLPLFL